MFIGYIFILFFYLYFKSFYFYDIITNGFEYNFKGVFKKIEVISYLNTIDLIIKTDMGYYINTQKLPTDFQYNQQIYRPSDIPVGNFSVRIFCILDQLQISKDRVIISTLTEIIKIRPKLTFYNAIQDFCKFDPELTFLVNPQIRINSLIYPLNR